MTFVQQLDEMTEEDLEQVKTVRYQLRTTDEGYTPEINDWIVMMARKYSGNALSKAAKQLTS